MPDVLGGSGGGGIAGIKPPISRLEPHVEQKGVPVGHPLEHFEQTVNATPDS
jgi:hypothetical protein